MLYDPRWNNPKPWTLEHLILWLGTKTGDYVYSDCLDCMLAQYASELGCRNVRVSQVDYSYQPIPLLFFIRKRKNLPAFFNSIALHGTHTFEAAYKRAITVRTNVEQAR